MIARRFNLTINKLIIVEKEILIIFSCNNKKVKIINIDTRRLELSRKW